MWNKVLPLAAVVLAVLLAGIVVLDLVRGQGGADSDERTARLIAMDGKIRMTGTSTVTFRADLHPAVGVGGSTWAGTSRIKWSGDDPATDTEFTEIKPVRCPRGQRHHAGADAVVPNWSPRCASSLRAPRAPGTPS